MTGLVRFVGILNAAIWLGGSVFFTFVAGQMPFSAETKALLASHAPGTAPYLVGAIAQIGVAKCFTFQLVCCSVALLHLAAEWLYQERRGRRSLLWLLVIMLGLTLAGNFVLRPRMEAWHEIKYRNYPQPVRDDATRSFKTWHAVSMTLNLLMLGGMVFYMWHMSRPPEPARFVRPGQIRS